MFIPTSIVNSTSMITIRSMTTQDTAIFRDVRLRSLLEAPMAFGSTYAKESQLTDLQWIERTQQRTDVERFVTFLAFDGESCSGIVSCTLDKAVAGRAWIISMWVAPQVRKQGVGARLMQAAEAWAVSRGVRELALDVSENNRAATKLYLRCGFHFTGQSVPYPNDPALRELAMLKRIGVENDQA